MTAADFVRHFGDVAEHSPWVAEAAAELRPFSDIPSMVAGFEAAMRSFSRERQLKLIRAPSGSCGKGDTGGEGGRRVAPRASRRRARHARCR
ncbi:MAG: 2-oxo-4-hydroxy-4-carboxy-5-ureidoimidazoline decarboxylase [Breoghania sp.]|nr:2-oxo-4-hydroxy-4-carboxy-5-ureidoimidazoline decarboxylase [Breoghania sp.]MDJ0929529.1 2-oxo-4-hydroxy-4-carboxy-5-ureidoimidazoline decarboxylase [Breoghania sp.]